VSLTAAASSDGFLSRHVDILLLLFALLCVFIVINAIVAAQRVSRIQQAQVEFVIQQNATTVEQNRQALCNQHDIIVAVKLLGDRLNILRINDIIVPDVTGLECS
jgi:hypothetical protein